MKLRPGDRFSLTAGYSFPLGSGSYSTVRVSASVSRDIEEGSDPDAEVDAARTELRTLLDASTRESLGAMSKLAEVVAEFVEPPTPQMVLHRLDPKPTPTKKLAVKKKV